MRRVIRYRFVVAQYRIPDVVRASLLLYACICSTLLPLAVFSQSAASPVFEIADVHGSAIARNPKMEGGRVRSGRYEVRRATLLDLIKTAYNVDADTVFGGPDWLDWNRFDIVARTSAGTSPETARLMLQTLVSNFEIAHCPSLLSFSFPLFNSARGQHAGRKIRY